jgi:hypothetical protein
MQLTVIDGGLSPQHEIRPEPASVISERTGGYASLLDSAKYPLTAECAGCGQPIRCATSMLADWQHEPVVPAPRSLP